MTTKKIFGLKIFVSRRTCCWDWVTAQGSRAAEVSTEGSTALLAASEDTADTQNLGPMMILGWGILRPSDLFSQQ